MAPTPSTGARTVTLNIDLMADLTGFGSATRLTEAHHRIAGHFASPLLYGPPLSEGLLAWVMHMFTEDEADLAQHLPPLWPRTAAAVARKAGRGRAEVEAVLDRLADHKNVIASVGTPRRYAILPVVPGTFEMVLITTDPLSRNAWHRRFAELFEELWDSGYIVDYLRQSRPPVRYLPVAAAAKSLYRAWPSDHLGEILEPYDDFAVASCQCRMAMALVGKGCGKPLDNCTSIGPVARYFVERGIARRVSRQEVLDLKREAEEHGAITWMMNEFHSRQGTISCSCCGCCCHGLRTLSEHNAPGAISQPHFLPRKIPGRCKVCKKCENVCPTKAWKVIPDPSLAPRGKRPTGERLLFDQARCVGCGLCVVGCPSGALELVPAADAQPPERGYLELILKMAPAFTMNSARVFLQRLFGPAGPSFHGPSTP
jgi:electron transport complex protein RnfB